MKKKILLAVLVLAVAATFVVVRYQYVAGLVLPRSAQALDLTAKDLTEADYEIIRESLPGCDIRWSVPYGDKTIPSDAEELTAEGSVIDWEALEYLPRLRTMNALGVEEQPRLLAFAQTHPDCRVVYDVPIGGTRYENNTTALTVENADPAQLLEQLCYLPELEEVTLTGALPEGEQLQALVEAFPSVSFRWSVSVEGHAYAQDTRQLSLTGSAAEAEEAVSRLPQLERVELTQSGLTEAEAMALADRYPDCFFVFDMTIGDRVYSTDCTELDVSGIPFESREQIEDLLPYFPRAERVVMCKCGLDDETMDALNRDYPDIRFVWSIRIRTFYVRTDATYFYPFKLDRNLYINNEEASRLRYCTDMVCIDVGHMGEITDCEWAAFMPELKYLIIGETAISDLTPLSNCKKLEYLEMFTIPVTDYSPLVECTGLRDLNLGKTYADATPISKMTWLKNLWWCGAPTRNLPSSNAMELLPEALPNTQMKLWLEHPTASGWRRLDNYYAMRDYMDMFYLP